MCKDNNNPIIITNNDNEEIVMMSIKTYEELYIKIKTSVLINESLENNTKDFIDGKEFFDLMRIKYEV